MAKKYQSEAFSKETTEDIALQFYLYFERKRVQQQLSLRDAETLIDFVSGPVPHPRKVGAVDLTQPQVSGGGKVRPTDTDVDRILGVNPWDAVFEEVIQRQEDPSLKLDLIYLAFREQKKEPDICEELHIDRSTYYRHRKTVLLLAGMLAVKNGILEF